MAIFPPYINNFFKAFLDEDGNLAIKVDGGKLQSADQVAHIKTVIETDESSGVVVKGGYIIRNSSSGYLITGAEIAPYGDLQLSSSGNKLSFC